MYFETPFFVFVFACCLNIIVMVNNHISQLGITENNKSMSPVPMTKDSFNWSPRHLCITLLFSSFHYLIIGPHCIDAPKHCDDRIYIYVIWFVAVFWAFQSMNNMLRFITDKRPKHSSFLTHAQESFCFLPFYDTKQRRHSRQMHWTRCIYREIFIYLRTCFSRSGWPHIVGGFSLASVFGPSCRADGPTTYRFRTVYFNYCNV